MASQIRHQDVVYMGTATSSKHSGSNRYGNTTGRAQSEIRGGGGSSTRKGEIAFGSAKPKLAVNFADAIKHGISSYSPLKSHHQSAKNSQDDEKGGSKKIKFGPPNVNLNDYELDEILEQTKMRVNTAASMGVTSIATGTSWFSNKHSQNSQKTSMSLNQKLHNSRDTRVLESYENYQKNWL